MADAVPGAAPVIDQRTSPRGVIPRSTQTWLMVGLAVGILGIIVFAGHPAPARPAAATPSTAVSTPSPERLREYQDRLRAVDERARQQAIVAQQQPLAMPHPTYDEPGAAPASPDPLVEERRRREYESLFASNVVMSRRPDGQRLMTDPNAPSRTVRAGMPPDAPTAPPNIDDVADAVVRATTRYTAAPAAATTAGTTNGAPNAASPSAPAATSPKVRPASTGPITSTGPTHRLLEGTMIDAVLTNRLDGSVAASVNCLVTNPVYSHGGEYIVVPAGSRVLGETKPVQSFGETRLAVAFNRLVLPDGSTYRLDSFMGLNDIGDAGLRDQVNQHYKSTFGASAAVGLITGFAQYLGTAAFSHGGGNTVIIAGGVGDATAQATSQTMNRYLNRMPTITIREGHRVKIYLTSDLELPAYQTRSTGTPALLAQSR
jgi:type IV secretory pathway VirB10-like protein